MSAVALIAVLLLLKSRQQQKITSSTKASSPPMTVATSPKEATTDANQAIEQSDQTQNEHKAVPLQTKNKIVDDGVSPNITPAPAHRYIDTFEALPTKDWFYEGRDVETVDRVDHAFTERDTKLDFRLLKLAELTTTDMISLNETPAQRNLAKIYDGSSALKASFLKGELISSELLDFPIDVPICTFNFNRPKSIRILRGRRLLMIEKSETFELQNEVRGVRVFPKSEPGKKSYWISSIECAVKESDKSQDLYKKILFIDFVATTGIAGKVYRNSFEK